MLYSICFILSVWIFGIAETGIACGSPLGTTTEVQRIGYPSAENRFVSEAELETICSVGEERGVRVCSAAMSSSLNSKEKQFFSASRLHTHWFI
jgi:hypothetical protein